MITITMRAIVVGPPLQNTRLRKVPVPVPVPVPEQRFQLLANRIDLSDVTQCYELASIRVGFKEVRKGDNGGGVGRHLGFLTCTGCGGIELFGGFLLLLL